VIAYRLVCPLSVIFLLRFHFVSTRNKIHISSFHNTRSFEDQCELGCMFFCFFLRMENRTKHGYMRRNLPNIMIYTARHEVCNGDRLWFTTSDV
jgi:hypothetical protein